MNAKDMVKLSVLEEFTMTPGPRYKHQGPFSGELFRQEVLKPKFEEALDLKTQLYVDLDGPAGYATSFLEEAFGGLARDPKFSSDLVLKTLVFKSEDDPYLEEDIRTYITEATLQEMV